MTSVKINSVDRWFQLMPKEELVLPGPSGTDAPRLVRINVNSPGARFYLVSRNQEQFLGYVRGLGVLEFVASREVRVATPDDDVWYWTSEQEPGSHEILDEATFTKIAARRARNPVLEQLMRDMAEKTELRLAAQARHFDNQLAAMTVARRPATPVEPNNDEPSDAPRETARPAAKPASKKANNGAAPSAPSGEGGADAPAVVDPAE